MGGGNGQKSKTARERNMEKNKAAKGSQLESNKKAMTIQESLLRTFQTRHSHLFFLLRPKANSLPLSFFGGHPVTSSCCCTFRRTEAAVLYNAGRRVKGRPRLCLTQLRFRILGSQTFYGGPSYEVQIKIPIVNICYVELHQGLGVTVADLV
ncbi:hypothetical protein MUK42_03201 [Musa troglodytarum]|uniref:Small EDRK-rich factor-like N-terminal domain-containing protein n=1 Tax=Musa troglodytarum TaxID=320322 RepID=A0A9E7HML1_9LILI|nr:hypothetical protein MUK42_03201 [Musa troglodytarum]